MSSTHRPSHVYRADIDGLRAIAVMTVVFYHTEWSLFSGGFIGVDVFFVISGYLITALLLRQMDAGTFTFGTFYIRRVRRLFPALFVTMAASFITALFLYSPQHLERFGGETVYALFSISNFYFWAEAGYFDADAIVKPLLHTWSLSVEEQFYFVWPPFLAALFFLSWQRWLAVILVLIGILSLAAAQWVIQFDQSAVFYLMPFRMFEFAIGAGVVLLERYDFDRLAAITTSIIAVSLILVLSVVYTHDTLFPGIAALWPCLATGMLLHRGQQGPVRQMLSTRPFVFLGKISYSLYLVHWPIIVFYKYTAPGPMDAFEIIGVTVISIVLATLLHYLVEQPFRNPKQRWAGANLSGAQTGLVCVALAAMLVLPSATAWGSQGFPWRVPAEVREAVAGLEEKRLATWRYLRGTNPVGSRPFTRQVPRVLVIGDSHAKDLFNGFHLNRRHIQELEFRGLSIDDKCLYLLRDGAQPLEGMRPEAIRRCEDDINALPDLQLFKQADIIVFTARWEDDTVALIPDLKAYLDTHGKKLVLFDRVTEFGDVPTIIEAFGRIRGANAHIVGFIDPAVDAVNRTLHGTASSLGIPVGLKDPIMCVPNRERCDVFDGKGGFLYYDKHGHWSLDGARHFGFKIVKRGVLQELIAALDEPEA